MRVLRRKQRSVRSQAGGSGEGAPEELTAPEALTAAGGEASAIIRRATVADAAGIAAVAGTVAAERIHSAIDRAWTVEEEARYLASQSSREALHVAVHGTRGIVGFQSIDLWSPLTSMGHVGQIGTFLLPDCRRTGLGRQLWAATSSFARAAGYRKCVIQVRASNPAAQAFYRGLGFKQCGRLTRQVTIDGVDDDELLMELFL
jgi:ribosomal protein S18 acetylase RimI-like enzyme